MTQVTKHEPGRWCWMELATTDPESAKAFYGGLFGWSFLDTPAGPGMTYTFVRLDGDDVGALYAQPAEQREAGAPPHWLPYVATGDADASVATARAAGGTVVGPHAVGEAGKSAYVTDPQGAVLGLWWAKEHCGTRRYGEIGALCWVELRTTDPEAAGDFYRRLFGWGHRDSSADAPGGHYVEWLDGAEPIGGMMRIPEEWGPVPPHWSIYLLVDDVDAVAARVGELGGKVVVPPTDIAGVGRFAAFADPQGAHFQVFRPEAQG
jgi:hypothetical protein